MIVGHGIDLVSIERIQRLVVREAFLSRVYTPAEREYCTSRSDSVSSFAACFAAKEAVSKALGVGIGARCALKDVELLHDENGSPVLRISGAALRTASETGASRWHLSITHDERLAIASVIIEG